MLFIKKYIYLILVVAVFFGCTEESPRIIQGFNSEWKFFLGNDSLASNTDYDDSEWQNLNLPHDWSIEGEFSIDNPTGPGGGALPAGIGWYRKYFSLKKSDNNKRIYIELDGIYRNSEVWINGHYLGKRANGYISFNYELTHYLNFGKEKNVLAVKVDNSLQPNSRWYTGSGIYRNVKLVKLSEVHIDQWGVFITTPEISKDSAVINVKIDLNVRKTNFEKIKVITSIVIKNNEKVATGSEYIEVKNGIPVINQNIKIKNPHLWSVNDPYLYNAVTEIFIDNKKTDERTTTFGIRYFHFVENSGFSLNGNPLKILGVNLHHDLGALGAAVNTRAMERQLQIMKEMGCNAIRTAHNPPAPEFLDLCDKMGFLVVDEAFDVWKKKKVKYDYSKDWNENHVQDLKDFILRDRNHPSVFIWSIGNEIREQFDSTGLSITRELVNIVKSLDNTRPVTCALTETDPAKNFIAKSGALDVLGFNYKHKDWDKFFESFPNQKMIPTENMSAYATRGHYDMPSDSVRYWPIKHGEPIIGANSDYTVSAYDMVCAYWGSTHEETLKSFYNSFVPGILVWCGIDFIGEPVPYEWPAKNSYYGIVDLAGFPKDVYYLYQSLWTDKPVLHVFPHWNWSKGKIIDVWAYYNNADEVELFLNEKSLGAKSKKDDFHVMWRINYEPGILKAISRKNGVTVLEKIIKTAGNPAKIELVTDRNTINADGLDQSFVTVKILDEDDNLVPYAENLVNFKISGNGFIAGVDNGYQASHEPFKANKRKAFNGMCLAIIQSNGKKGKIVLEATSERLSPASVIIKAK